MVEILSPSTIQAARSVKFQIYTRYGVPYYWIADPDARTIEAYRLTPEGYDLTGRMEGDSPIALQPFTDLVLAPGDVGP